MKADCKVGVVYRFPRVYSFQAVVPQMLDFSIACALNAKVLKFKDKVVMRQVSCYTTDELMLHKSSKLVREEHCVQIYR